MFLNETQHLQAPLLAACLHNLPSEDEVYINLERWRVSRCMSDEQAADLYSRIAEDSRLLGDIRNRSPIEDLATVVSKHLWASDKEFPHG